MPSEGSSSWSSSGAGSEQPQRLACLDGEQHGGADDLAGPQVDGQAGLLQRRSVFEASWSMVRCNSTRSSRSSPCGNRPPRISRRLSAAMISESSSASRWVATRRSGSSSSATQAPAARWAYLPGVARRSRSPVGLDDPRPHGSPASAFQRHSITRLLPGVSTASRSPRGAMPVGPAQRRAAPRSPVLSVGAEIRLGENMKSAPRQTGPSGISSQEQDAVVGGIGDRKPVTVQADRVGEPRPVIGVRAVGPFLRVVRFGCPITRSASRSASGCGVQPRRR